MKPHRSRSLRRAVVVAVAGGLLSACSSHPGDAAVVGSSAISESRVDAVAAALCSAQSVSQQTTAPVDLASRAARQGALGVLIQSELSRQYAASRGLRADPAQVSAAVASQQQTIDRLPASRRAAFRSVLQEYAAGQIALARAGAQQLAAAGTQNPTQDQALQAGQKLRDAWVRRHATVSVDPRFGRFRAGGLVADSGSLSVPQSATAVAGANDSPSRSWVSNLPANQKCA